MLMEEPKRSKVQNLDQMKKYYNDHAELHFMLGYFDLDKHYNQPYRDYFDGLLCLLAAGDITATQFKLVELNNKELFNSSSGIYYSCIERILIHLESKSKEDMNNWLDLYMKHVNVNDLECSCFEIIRDFHSVHIPNQKRKFTRTKNL